MLGGREKGSSVMGLTLELGGIRYKGMRIRDELESRTISVEQSGRYVPQYTTASRHIHTIMFG